MHTIQKFLKDARHFQIVYLFVFIAYGLINLEWIEHVNLYFIAIISALGAQALFSYWKLGEVKGLKSAMITALGLCLLLRTNSSWAMFLASFIGIAAKFLFRIGGKHLFNPSNIGIIALLLLTNSVWVSPGQWGNGAVLMFLIAATGSIVLLKVGRLDVTYIFLGTLFILEYVRTVLFLGWGMDVLIHKFTSGSLLLFAFFRITDPKTTPDNKKMRYLWAAALAVITFTMSQWFYLYSASIWALFFITPLTLLIDKFFPAMRFVWIDKRVKTSKQTV